MRNRLLPAQLAALDHHFAQIAREAARDLRVPFAGGVAARVGGNHRHRVALNGVDGLLAARVDHHRVARVRRAQVFIERLIRHEADVLARDDPQVAQLDAVVAHGHGLKERRADGRTPILVHAAVQTHIHAARARQLQHLQRLVFDAHAVLIFKVRDDHPAARDLGQLNGLAERVEVGHGEHARVDGGGSAVAARHRAQRLHLLKRRARRIARPEGNAGRAALQRALTEGLHRVHLRAFGRGEQIGDARRLAQRAQADHLRLMNRKCRLAAQKCVYIQRGKAAVAAHRRRDALKQGERAGVFTAVDMAVRVNKAGADEAAGSVDHPRVLRRARLRRLDGGDAPVLAEHIGLKARQGLRVDDRAAGNEQL